MIRLQLEREVLAMEIARVVTPLFLGMIVSLSCACGGAQEAPAQPSVSLENAFPKLRFEQPTDFAAIPGGNRLVVVERAGRIRVFSNDSTASEAAVLLDIRSRVSTEGLEMGLLGVAFHPRFSENGFFFVNYTAPSPRRTVIARYRASGNQADPASETVILSFEQPYANHNGGQVAFGPDGYLYIGTGDGGSAGDPHRHGQNRSTLLGSWLRIDVDRQSGDRRYAIPSDNPYAGNTQGFREEIYAYGLRNLWRFSYDPDTRRWWGGDVGQNRVEEIDILESGKNYGWPIMEGTLCYPEGPCDRTGLTLPVAEYPRNKGRSVTGGFVYRGRRVPELVGAYVYADVYSGRLWRLDYDEQRVTRNEQIAKVDAMITTFGLDADRELYMADFNHGVIYRFR